MNKMVKIGSLCLIVALFVAGVSGCKQDEGDGWVSTLGAPKIGDISGLTVFTDDTSATALTSATTFSQAESFVSDFLGIGSSLGSALNDAQSQAFYKAFTDRYETSFSAWSLSQYIEKKSSYSVNINDDASLKAYPANTKVTVGNIKASVKQSQSHNRLLLGQANSWAFAENGDKLSSSSSINGTISITGGYVTASNYKVAGIIKVEASDKEEKTTKDVTNKIRNESGSTKTKLALTVLVSDSTNVAKIRFSFASDSAKKERSVGGAETYNLSDIEVYTPAGALITTIPANQLSDEAEDFIGDFLGELLSDLY